MDPERRRKRRSRRTPSDDVVDLSNQTNRQDSNESVREIEAEDVAGNIGNIASSSVAIVDLTKDSNDSSILSNDVVDLTGTAIHEDIIEVTPAKRSRSRRRRSAQQLGSRNSVVISSGEESDGSDDDLVLLNSPLLPEDSIRTLSPLGASPAKKAIKCPICFEDEVAIKRSGARLMSTNCGHVFCENCIRTAVESQHKCPTCRKRLTLRQIHPIFL